MEHKCTDACLSCAGFLLSAHLNACLCVCVRERGVVHVQKNAEGGWLAAGHAGGRRVSKFVCSPCKQIKSEWGTDASLPAARFSPFSLRLFHLLTSFFSCFTSSFSLPGSLPGMFQHNTPSIICIFQTLSSCWEFPLWCLSSCSSLYCLFPIWLLSPLSPSSLQDLSKVGSAFSM